jgi:isoprenylcysteine carboxyl methyltransferase (ICMT) family protein YpbQ
MRFFVTGEQNRQLLLNTLILMFLGYIVLLWLSNGLLFFHKMDLTADSVVSYYLGSEEEFTQPKSYQSLLETSHFHFFAMGMLILTLTHLMLMTSMSTLAKVWLSAAVYLSAVADEIAGWLVRFVSPLFAYFKIAAFIMLELSMAAVVIAVIISLLQARKRQG